MTSRSKMRMQHKTDPAVEIRERVGDISDMRVMHNQLLVAIYLRPDKIDLGNGKALYLSDKTRQEDEYQGKVGLVLAKGKTAFVDDATTKFNGEDVKEGDWVMFRTSDGFPFQVGSNLCRLLEDVHIKAVIPRPDYIY